MTPTSDHIHPMAIRAVECSSALRRDEYKKWKVFHDKICSFPYTRNPGRTMYFNIYHSDFHLGIIALGSPVIKLGPRDKRIGNTPLTQVAEMTRCVPNQPFGYNSCGGKLLASIALLLAPHYKAKYGDQLKYMTTMGLNGRPSQYDRIPWWKFIGYTQGYGTIQVAPEEYALIRTALKSRDALPSRDFGAGSNYKYRVFRAYEKLFGEKLPRKHNQPRSIYLAKIPIEPRIGDVVVWWRERWAKKREQKVREGRVLREPRTCEIF